MSNFYVDGGAALTSDRDDWETPRWLFDKLDAVWHFTLDPASNGRNALCEKFFTKEDDGLAQSWGGAFCVPQPTVRTSDVGVVGEGRS